MLLIAGCSGPPSGEREKSTPAPQLGERIGDNIGQDGGTYKYVDNESGNVCYVVQNDHKNPAIDCVPQHSNDGQ